MAEYKFEAVTLNVYGKSAEKYGITWQTDEENTPAVQYTEESDPEFLRAVTVKAKTSESLGCIKNSAVLENLEKGKYYLWRVGDGENFSETFRFKTLSPKKDVGFYYFADTQDVQNHGTWWKAAWEDAIERYPDPDFYIHGGDIVHMSGIREFWQRMTDNNREYMTSYPAVPASGNHDWWECYLDGYRNTFEKHFTLDLPPQDTTYGVYYSLDIGDVHITVMNPGSDVNTVDGFPTEQLRWIMNDVRSTDKKWKIVMSHIPFYSPGKYGCRPDWNTPALTLRKNLAELFAKEGVDLILSGHDHIYSLSYPVIGDGKVQSDCKTVIEKIDGIDAPVFIKPKGPLNLLPGCAGNQFREVDWAFTPEYGEFLFDKIPMRAGAVGYSAIKINGDTLTAVYRMISADNKELLAERAFGIRK